VQVIITSKNPTNPARLFRRKTTDTKIPDSSKKFQTNRKQDERLAQRRRESFLLTNGVNN
jgi:hypothetical protein